MSFEADIAGVRVRLGGVDEPLARPYRRFPASNASDPRLAVEISVVPRRVEIPPRIGDDAPEYPLEIARDGSLLRLSSWLFDGWVDLDDWRGAASVDPRDAAGSVENFLRVAIAHLLLPRGGFLLHAAAVLTGRGAVICFGPSDAGKTTISSLAGDRPVVSDDLIACRLTTDGRLLVVPTPFRAGNATAFPAGHEVKALLRLRKGPRHLLERLDRTVAARELVGAMPFVHDEPSSSAAALQLACETAIAPGVQRLTFLPDASVWPFVESALAAGDSGAGG